MTPEFHREIGMPRVAAIEYPYGRPVGQVNDVEGQRMVLREALSFMEKAENPGEVRHLPFVRTNASGVHSVPISEHMLALVLALARDLPASVLAQRDDLF